MKSTAQIEQAIADLQAKNTAYKKDLETNPNVVKKALVSATVKINEIRIVDMTESLELSKEIDRLQANIDELNAKLSEYAND